MNKEKIENFVEKHLQKLMDWGGNSLPIKIALEMFLEDDKDDWQKWKPIPSRVSDEEIEELESRLGCKLPDDYITFLKYKHFYELIVGEVEFYPHPIHSWRKELSEAIFEGYPRVYLFEKGYIPFANWSDWGMLCFDTNRGSNTDYPIVLWDHETVDEVQEQYENFMDMIQKIDQ